MDNKDSRLSFIPELMRSRGLFSLKIDGRPLSELSQEYSETIGEGKTVGRRLIEKSILAETTLTYYPEFGTYEWVTTFENVSDADSGTLSDIYDCDVALPFEYDAPEHSYGILPAPQTAHVFNPLGSTCVRGEFSSTAEPVAKGRKLELSTDGGRSSQKRAPFFDICRAGEGYIFAIGWSGQWACTLTRPNADICVKTGVEEAEFFLRAGEKVRTTSFVVMPYALGQDEGHNRWRRLVKKHFSLIGRPGRDAHGSLSSMFWGSVPSDVMIDRVKKIAEHKMGVEYIWIDAGWYGYSTSPCANEFEGDWYSHTGSWTVNKNYHPDGLKEVARAIRENGMKFLLWVEPERCLENTDSVKNHPDYFFKRKNRNQCLLNLGNPDACAYAIDTISTLVSELGLSCYRQDFNIDPLRFWLENDEPGRKGLCEIKHINGLYRFWDTLLERFPNLIIDNCASGGRRIDIETLRRSIPMWRSDFQCMWNREPESTQTHSGSFAWWMPYSGTGSGNVHGDSYFFRSTYAPSLVLQYWGYMDREFNEAEAETMRAAIAEYLSVCEYLDCDFYPLILSPLDDSGWAASQYNRPENGDGIVLAFRRPSSPFDRAEFTLKGLDNSAAYEFTDADTGETFTLYRQNLTVTLPEKRSSRLYLYKKRQ